MTECQHLAEAREQKRDHLVKAIVTIERYVDALNGRVAILESTLRILHDALDDISYEKFAEKRKGEKPE